MPIKKSDRPVDRTRRGREWNHFPGQTSLWLINSANQGPVKNMGAVYPSFVEPGLMYSDRSGYGGMEQPLPRPEWNGKKFVRRGQKAPSGWFETDLVYESKLFGPYKLVGPNEMSSWVFDPTRLTIYLDHDDVIDYARYG